MKWVEGQEWLTLKMSLRSGFTSALKKLPAFFHLCAVASSRLEARNKVSFCVKNSHIFWLETSFVTVTFDTKRVRFLITRHTNSISGLHNASSPPRGFAIYRTPRTQQYSSRPDNIRDALKREWMDEKNKFDRPWDHFWGRLCVC